MRGIRLAAVGAVVGLLVTAQAAVAVSPQSQVGINVVLKQSISAPVLADLAKYGRVLDTYPEISALTMRVRVGDLASIQQLPYVAAANEDQKRVGKPTSESPYTSTASGVVPWDLDQIDVADTPGAGGRLVSKTGAGVYVAVLDTGLLSSWRYYFNPERIATEYAKAFGGGGGEQGSVSSQPNKWQTDQDSHGTHVTSTILGYNIGGAPIMGVAPMAKVIPVKVLGQSGSGWSSMVAAGIKYVGDLKAGPLAGSPVVINMSLGGPVLDAMEKAAIDYAIAQGVIIVASAGNSGTYGMGYPGAYAPVISVAASGWQDEWWPLSNGRPVRDWWYSQAVPEDASAAYITTFSSRALSGQDLDIAAPGSWIVGPYQTNGQISYYFLGGTSMASPHVAGAVALMAQKCPSLSAAGAESALEGSAVAIPAGPRTIHTYSGTTTSVAWGSDATGAGLLNVPAALAAVCGS